MQVECITLCVYTFHICFSLSNLVQLCEPPTPRNFADPLYASSHIHIHIADHGVYSSTSPKPEDPPSSQARYISATTKFYIHDDAHTHPTTNLHARLRIPYGTDSSLDMLDSNIADLHVAQSHHRLCNIERIEVTLSPTQVQEATYRRRRFQTILLDYPSKVHVRESEQPCIHALRSFTKPLPTLSAMEHEKLKVFSVSISATCTPRRSPPQPTATFRKLAQVQDMEALRK
jgi:hypothetical protein